MIARDGLSVKRAGPSLTNLLVELSETRKMLDEVISDTTGKSNAATINKVKNRLLLMQIEIERYIHEGEA